MITEQSEAPAARDVLDSLPVQSSPADSLKDLIAQEREEKQGPLGSLLSGMSWIVYAVALGALALMVWAMFSS